MIEIREGRPADGDLVHSLVAQRGGHEVIGYSTMSALNRLWELISEYECRSVIEIGSFVGMSAIFFSDVTPVELVYCVDPFDMRHIGHPQRRNWPHGDQYTEFLHNTLPYVNIHHLKMTSEQAAKLDFQADLVYIDGDHSYQAVKHDIQAWAPHARKVLVGDDVNKGDVDLAVTELGIPHRDERLWWVAGEELEEWRAERLL